MSQRGLSFTETLSTLRVAQTGGYFSGPFFGMRPPKIITGSSYLPLGYGQATTFGSTATRVYYTPRPCWQTRDWPSIQVLNTSGGETGQKIRIMTFADDGAAGGPGTLVKDWGEITLTAAAALRTLTPATPLSAVAGTMYWDAVWTESATSLITMTPGDAVTAVGFAKGPNFGSLMGCITPVSTLATEPNAYIVDTAYGAAPATAVAPTSTAMYTPGATAGLTPAVRWKA